MPLPVLPVPVVLFVKSAGLTPTGGSVRTCQSGPRSERRVSQLCFRRYSKAASIGSFAGTLDDAGIFRPGFHVHQRLFGGFALCQNIRFPSPATRKFV
jgi:hypothetical protein